MRYDDDAAAFPEEWLRAAHRTLTRGGGMLGVVYRRQLRRVRELRRQLEEQRKEAK